MNESTGMAWILRTLFLILMFPQWLWAQETFGAEFTYTNARIRTAQTEPNLVNNPESERYRDLLAQRILARCDHCRVVVELNPHQVKVLRIVYPDGFYFVVATDPSVVEVQMKPVTITEIKAQMSRIQNDLFDSAGALGIFPAEIGGGHVHVGLKSAIGNDVKLLRNLLVDMANHPELSMGILVQNRGNSETIASLPQQKIENLKRIIQEVDAGQITDVRSLVVRVHDEVYDWHPNPYLNPPQKFRDLNLIRIEDYGWSALERTFEFRGIRAQKNGKEFLAMAELLSGRLAFLRKLRQPLRLDIPDVSPRFTAVEKVQRFANYVAEAGLDFREWSQQFEIGAFSEAINNQVEITQPEFPRNIFCEKIL